MTTTAALTTVLDDIATQRVNRTIFLGNAGHTPRILAALQVRKIPCVFGNWEVSGLRRLSGALAAWVSGGGDQRNDSHQGDAVFCHATPDIPPALATTGALSEWMQPGMS